MNSRVLCDSLESFSMMALLSVSSSYLENYWHTIRASTHVRRLFPDRTRLVSVESAV